MINSLKLNTTMEVNGKTFILNGGQGGCFTATTNDYSIYFKAEGRNGGLYFNIISVTYNNKTYKAQRYHYKYIIVVREISIKLRKNNYLWDYVQQKPLLEV